MSEMITTIDGKKFYLHEVDEVQFVYSDRRISNMNLFWCVFWLVMFFPVAFVVLYLTCKKVFRCRITLGSVQRTYTLDADNYDLLFTKEGIQ